MRHSFTSMRPDYATGWPCDYAVVYSRSRLGNPGFRFLCSKESVTNPSSNGLDHRGPLTRLTLCPGEAAPGFSAPGDNPSFLFLLDAGLWQLEGLGGVRPTALNTVRKSRQSPRIAPSIEASSFLISFQ